MPSMIVLVSLKEGVDWPRMVGVSRNESDGQTKVDITYRFGPP